MSCILIRTCIANSCTYFNISINIKCQSVFQIQNEMGPSSNNNDTNNACHMKAMAN